MDWWMIALVVYAILCFPIASFVGSFIQFGMGNSADKGKLSR